MFPFEDAVNVLIEGVTFRDMPAWTISVHDCDDVAVRGVTVDNHMRIPNCDGVSIMNSLDVRISDCSIRSYDDSITIGTRAESEALTAGITVTNCTLASAACAIKFGSETHARSATALRELRDPRLEPGPGHPAPGRGRARERPVLEHRP